MIKTAPELNERQRQVAEDTQHHILLLAGAGTGKTNTLACRVANLLNTGAAKPEEILCLTFTNRACKEMVERIGKMAGEAAGQVVVRTVHSFCAWLLRQTPESLTDIGRDFTICDAPDCLEVIQEVVLEVIGREIEPHPAGVLQAFIGLVKDRQLLDPGSDIAAAAAWLFTHQRGAIERVCTDRQRQFDPKFFAFLAKYGASLVRSYNLKLTQNNMLDFSDLLLRADRLLADPETAGLWLGQFRFVHVDEVQDVSLAEYGLIKKLCGRATVLLCGDFNQTIYQWRGSDPDGLTGRFTEDFQPLVVEFEKNYRSSGQLLSAAKNVLHNAFGKGVSGGLNPHASDCTDLAIREFETMPDEVDWIYREIAALEIEDYSRVAIITRNNKACADVCALLKSSGQAAEKQVRFMLADEFRLFKRAEVKDLLSCVSLLANPRDGESLRRVLSRLIRGVGPATVNAVLTGYREGLGVALTDFIDPRSRQGDFFEGLLVALDAGNVVVFDVESTGTDVYTNEIIQMAAVRLGPDGKVAGRFERFLRPDGPVGGSERVHGFSDDFLRENGEDPKAALEAFLDFVDGSVIVGHNVGFDMTITAQNLTRRGVARPFRNPWYDTLDLSRRFLGKLENHKLCTVAAALGAENDPSHDAMDDILATADVLNLLCAQYLRPQTEARRAFYGRYLGRFEPAARLVQSLRGEAFPDAPALLDRLMEVFQLQERYSEEPEKLGNLLLFCAFVQEYADREKPLEQQLADVLELSALSASELDRMTKSANKVAVITAHQSKGCEFDYVFLPVMQDGVFPSYQAVKSGSLEEEKRVFYVSVTRAKRKLFLSCSHYNLNHYPCKPSRFLKLLEP